MAQPRLLRNAPITEAIVDLRTTPAPKATADALAAPPETLAAGFGQPKPIDLQEVGVVTEADGRIGQSSFVDHGCIGQRYTAADQRQVVQLRIDGFTFHQLEPYTSWESVWAAVEQWLSFYLHVRRSMEIQRIAVRYINRLRLPATDGRVDLKDFLTAAPALPAEMTSTELVGFLTQIQVAERTGRQRATIMQSLRPLLPSEQDIAPVVLDIDAFETQGIRAELEPLRTRFAALRDYKNRLFFSLITEQTANLCQ